MNNEVIKKFIGQKVHATISIARNEEYYGTIKKIKTNSSDDWYAIFDRAGNPLIAFASSYVKKIGRIKE